MRDFALAMTRRARNVFGMSQDDASDFRPRIGRIRDRGGASRRPQLFVDKVMKAAARPMAAP